MGSEVEIHILNNQDGIKGKNSFFFFFNLKSVHWPRFYKENNFDWSRISSIVSSHVGLI